MVNKHFDIALSIILEDSGRETTIDDKILYGINSSHLELIVNDIGEYLSTEKEKIFCDIGHLKIENAKVQLIDYFFNKTIMTQFSN